MAKSKTPAKKAAVKAPKKQAAAPTASAAPVSAKIEANRAEQNGVIRPSAGTFCAKVWEALDTLHAAGTDITVDAIRVIAGTEMADATVRTQRQRWRTFVGLPRNAKASKAAGT